MNARLDLHLHSTASDGRLTPSQVVSRAASRGLRLIALTDHDTTNGCAEAHAQSERDNIRLLTGVELNTDSDLGEVHVLGYFKEVNHPDLQTKLNDTRVRREERAEQMVAKLNALGIALTYADVKAQAGPGAVGRPHVAMALMAKGFVGDKQAAFDLYIGSGKPAYVPRYAFHPREAIQLIRACGGVASLAHSIRSGSIKHLPSLAAWGLNALEVYYFDHEASHIAELKSLAKKFNLLHTGGSDFHEVPSNGFRDIGSVWAPEEVGEKLWEKVMRKDG